MLLSVAVVVVAVAIVGLGCLPMVELVVKVFAGIEEVTSTCERWQHR